MDKIKQGVLLAQAFTPATPVSLVDLFMGRFDQIMECTTALSQPGMHISVYGERGVGKTSLANVLPDVVNRAGQTRGSSIRGVRVNCDTEDDFASLWSKVFREVKQEAAYRLPSDVDPEFIRFELAGMESVRLIVIDELDRLENDNALSLLADTIKTFSDHQVGTTLMLVGVAKSLDDLLGEHHSIVRSIVQIPMPRMSPFELGMIIEKGLARVEMTIADEAKARIVELAEGLPHYVHLLCLRSGEHAINDDRLNITNVDVDRAMEVLFRSHSLMTAYVKATRSNQRGNLYAKVLLACACAPKSDMGSFRPSDVAGPLAAILGKPVTISTFSRHLDELASDRRGNAILKEGTARRFEFRFDDPLLQPFIKMASITKQVVSRELFAEISKPESVPTLPREQEWPSADEPPS